MRRSVHCALPAAALAALLPLGAAWAEGPAVTVRFEDLQTLRTRLEWSWPGAALVYTELRESGPGTAGLLPRQAALGFDCPALVVGTVRTEGLLRQLANPLGYLPGSAVYGEAAGLHLERGIDPGRLRGAELRLAGGGIHLFALQEERGERSPRAGVCLRLPRRSDMELLALLGRPPPSRTGEEWFPQQAPYPGGELGHAAVQLRAAGQGLDLRLSGAASGGERVRPGAWGSAGCTLHGQRAEVGLLVGACGADYRAPTGEVVAERTLAAASLVLRAPGGGRVELGASRRTGTASGGATASTDRVEFGVHGGASPGRQLRFEGSLQRDTESPGQGSLAAEGRLRLEGARGGRGQARRGSPALSAELAGACSTAGSSQASLALRWRSTGRTSLGLEAEALLADGGGLELRGAAVLWRPGYRFYCRLRTPTRPPAEALSLVLGWQTNQPGRRSSRAVCK